MWTVEENYAWLRYVRCQMHKLGMPVRAGNLNILPLDLRFRTETRPGKSESAINFLVG